MKTIDKTTPVDPVIFALLYGASGTGKTDFCGSLGALGKVLVIDIDHGSLTLRTSPRVKPYLKNIHIVSFDAFKDLDTAYKAIQKNDPENWNKLFGTEYGKVTDPFDWIVWDSWSELQWNMLQELRVKEGLSATALDFRKNIQIQHWGMLTDLNKLSIESLRNLKNVNQVFVMLETMTKDELSKQIFGGPAFHGKMVYEMPGYFDIVVHATTDVLGNHFMSTKAKGRWAAKTRLGPAQELKNGTASDIFKVVPA